MLLLLGLFSWLVMGLAVGVLARTFLPGLPKLPWFLALGAGIGGAWLGGFLATALGFGGLAGFDPRALAIATLGAVLALLVTRTLSLGRVQA